jgi:hypothetical protein
MTGALWHQAGEANTTEVAQSGVGLGSHLKLCFGLLIGATALWRAGDVPLPASNDSAPSRPALSRLPHPFT